MVRNTIKNFFIRMSYLEKRITSQGRDSIPFDEGADNMGETPMLETLEGGIGNEPGTVDCVSGHSIIVSPSAPTLKTTNTKKRSNYWVIDPTTIFTFSTHENKIEQTEDPCAFAVYHWMKMATKDRYSMPSLRDTPCLIVHSICEFLDPKTVEGYRIDVMF